MGAADVVPGVSGGTIAFITGIYDELLRSISAVPYAVGPLLRGRFAEAWKTANASFLLVLFAGILTSILSLARLITYLLEAHPIPVWSFFFGLILVSVHLVGKEIQRRNLSRLVSFCLGIGFAYWITVAAPMQLGEQRRPRHEALSQLSMRQRGVRLVHRLVDRHAVLVAHLVELVDADAPAVRQHHRAALEHEPPVRVPHHRRG